VSENTKFNYLLNAFEHASQDDNPAAKGYAEKRRALIAHVRGLEADAAELVELRRVVGPKCEFGRRAIAHREHVCGDGSLVLLYDSAKERHACPITLEYEAWMKSREER
jgi:hypothetical protein